MKIGIVGATGNFGKGLVYRWAKNHTIYIGSRFEEKGEEKAKEYGVELEKYGISPTLIGTNNSEAIKEADVVVLSVKLEYLIPLIAHAYDQFNKKIVISPIVSLSKGECFQYEPPPEGSAALFIQKRLPNSTIVSTLHTIPANRLCNLNRFLEGDVPVCSDNREAKEIVKGLVKEIEQLNPIDAGPLEVSKMVEPMVPLILNLKQYGLKKDTSIKFI